MKTRFFSSLAALAFFIAGCGGGGGGSDFVGAANVSITVDPGSIDIHDRTQVKIRITDVIDAGIILKTRFPNDLSYSVNTATLQLDGDSAPHSISPAVNQDKDDTTYLVFFLSRDDFGPVIENSDGTNEQPSKPGTLTFELSGEAPLQGGQISVDPDVNDPTIDDAVEFNVNDPQFEGQASAGIQVQ